MTSRVEPAPAAPLMDDRWEDLMLQRGSGSVKWSCAAELLSKHELTASPASWRLWASLLPSRERGPTRTL